MRPRNRSGFPWARPPHSVPSPCQDAPPPAPAQSVTGARIPEVRSQTPRPPAVRFAGTPGPQSRTLQFSQQNRSDAPRSSAPRSWGPSRRPAIPWKVEARVLPQVPSLPGASADHLLPTVRAAPACAVSAQRSWETGVQAQAEDRAPPPGGSSGDGRDIRGWVEITRAHSSLAGLHQAPSRGFFILFLEHPGSVTVTSSPGEEMKHREEKQSWRWSQVPSSFLEFIFLTPLARCTFFFIRISPPLCICCQGAHVSPRSLGSLLGLMLLSPRPSHLSWVT